MNNKKRVLAIVLTVILMLTVCMTGLVSCMRGDDLPTVDEQYVTILMGVENLDNATSENVSIKGLEEGATISDMLAANPKFYADLQDSEYGAFLAGIGSLVPDPSYQFIGVYSTDATYTGEFSTEQSHGEKKFTSTSVGISEVVIKNKESYAFVLENFSAPPVAPDVTPMIADERVGLLVKFMNTKLEPTVAYAENINTMTRAGVKLTDDFYDKLTQSLLEEMAKFDPNAGGMNYNRGHVIYTTSALLHAGRPVPVEAIDYINGGSWIDDAIREWTCGVMLPVIKELENAGYEMTVTERAITELMSTTVNNQFQMKWDVDSGSVAIIAMLPYYNRPEVKTVIDNTLRTIESRMKDNNIKNNICSTAYVLALAVECNYYKVSNSLRSDKVYEWIIGHQDETGNLGYAFENVQSLRALASYQLNEYGYGTFYSKSIR